jgi:uncharacterized protein YyaL (SSP411 family)
MTRDYEKLASDLDLNEKELKNHLEVIRKKLLKQRNQRTRPAKDDKILTDWNGLMVAALAQAGQVFEESEYIETAKKTADFIFENLQTSEGKLLHRYRNGNADIEAFVDDYTFLIWGLIELYETTFEVEYLKKALELNDILIEDFWDDYIGGFFFTSNESEKVLTKQKEIYDSAIPSGNSVAMLNLLRLSLLSGDSELEEKAEYIARVFSESVQDNPVAHTQLLVAIDFALGPTYSLVISGNRSDEKTREFLKKIHSTYLPNKALIYRPTDTKPAEIDQIATYVEDFRQYNEQTTAYVCVDKTCKPPTNDIEEALGNLKSEWNV